MPAFDSLVNRVIKLALAGDPRDMALAVPSSDSVTPPPAKTNRRREKGGAGRRTDGAGMGSTFGDPRDGKDRRQKYRDMAYVDHEVPEASIALDAIASNTTSGEPGSVISGFQLEFDPAMDEQRREIAEAVVERTQLKTLLQPTVRSANELGDVGSHLTVDNQGLIWEAKNLEPGLLSRRHDEYDRLTSWWYAGYADKQQELSPWEVVHWSHSPKLGALWGRSMFEAGREIAYALIGIRNGMTFQAVNHAASRMAFVFGRPQAMEDDDREAWLDDQYEVISKRKAVDSTGLLDRRMVQTINDQHLVLDYPVNIDGKGPEPRVYPMGAADLDQLVAVAKHVRDVFVVLVRTPRAFIGIEEAGEGIGGNRTQVQEVQYAKVLNNEQHQAAWYVLQIIARQFLFLGMPLERDMVRVVMPDLRVLDRKLRADTLFVLMQAANLADGLGLPFPYIWVDILHDGDEKVAAQVADRIGFDVMGQDAKRQAQQAAQQAAQVAIAKAKGAGQPPPGSAPQGTSQEAQVRHLMADVDRLRQGIKAAMGARVGNAEVSPR